MTRDGDQWRRLTEREEAYVSGLSLTRIADQEVAAAWVERCPDGEAICWRTVGREELGAIGRLAPQVGHPAVPKIVGDRLLWVEYRDAAGILFEADLAAAGPRRVAALANANVGEFAALVLPGGSRVLLAEDWCADHTELRLLADAEECLGEAGNFRTRPRLAAHGDIAMAAWDEYDGGRYRVMTAQVTPGEPPLLRPLPSREGWWDSLPAVACSEAGVWYAARCRECLVALEGNAAGHHSELLVSVLEDNAWRDLEPAVCIDHALNPWMAAYWGLRRFPILLPLADGVRLLWEEKQDVATMDPCLGRLCGLSFPQPAAPQVQIDGRCMFVIDAGGLVATKTQWRGYEQHVPYEVQWLDLAEATSPRPTDLESNAAAPAFIVNRPDPGRPHLDGAGRQLFFGDPHLHSRFSQDLDGELDELYHFARDVAAVDFVAFTDNDLTRYTEPLNTVDWQRIRRFAELFNDPGRFTAFLGWEYTLHEPPTVGNALNSHRCVIFPGDDGPIYPCYAPDSSRPPALARKFAGQRVLLHHHHPMGYDITDDALERNIEVCSGWWNCMHRPEFVERLHELLGRGLRLGLFGASDNHERNPGLGGALTGVWAEENTRESIFEAFCQHRIFATTGLRPDLRFAVGGIFMGGEGEVDGSPLVELTVRCPVPVSAVRLIRDGFVVHQATPNDADLALAWQDYDCPAGGHYYYAHITFAGDEPTLPWNLAPAYGLEAWSSPVWIKR